MLKNAKKFVKDCFGNQYNKETFIHFEKTVKWYKDFYENNQTLTKKDLDSYVNDAKLQNIEWTK